PKDGEVGLGIVANHIASKRTAIGQHDSDPIRVIDNVAVGEDQAVRRKNEPRSTSAILAPTTARCRGARTTSHVDLDDGRADHLDGPNHRARIRIQKRVVAFDVIGWYRGTCRRYHTII